MNTEQIKVHFLQALEGDEYHTETMWCNKDSENYILDNIPCIAKNISLSDIISVEYDQGDDKYYFDEFIEYSGNSTVRLVIEDEVFRREINKEFEETFGCKTTMLKEMNLLAVNIRKNVDYRPIKIFLQNGEDQGKWNYEESCLSDEHRNQINFVK
ncbi:DUF4265 domain-containing protein [Chitinophaga filiformis]|uniref:DUF4265 domain-containing protein n=1 Tax=Chitinophaga filiformis TaxID=104663 RepID=A0ABY4HW13_CHIFI|nr:DUF4265 domain-containing protein [Chitinophaga filiformis]UPK67970.1 DUF4265 domain-containing protein [Chitinophaga filiformis]